MIYSVGFFSQKGKSDHFQEHDYASKKVILDQAVQITMNKEHLCDYDDDSLINGETCADNLF